VTDTTQTQPQWAELLAEAVSKPGIISAAYSRFWNYSFGNQLLAMMQCHQRGIEPGPIHTFKGWLALGRAVQKGQKAIELCMPIGCKKTVTTHDDATGTDVASEVKFARFVYRRNWFVLSQTAGDDYQPEPVPDWDESRAMAALNVCRVNFDKVNGNCQGYAFGRMVAVSPLAELPTKTLFHELAHVVLGHTAEGTLTDSNVTPKTIREAEAEGVALLCCESLGLPGADHCRGYIQHYIGREPIPETSARRIFKAADAILKAGRPAPIESAE
jgi:antirestriction protein ArdC